MPPPAPRRPPPQAAALHPPRKGGLQPGDEAIEVGGRWAQKAVRGEWEGLRRREHLNAPVHLATPVPAALAAEVAALPAAASAAPRGPVARGWAGRAGGAPAAPAAAAAAGAGTGVVASAAWPQAQLAAANQAWAQHGLPPPQARQQPRQHRQHQHLAPVAEEPGLQEDEEVEQSRPAESAGNSSEYGVDEGGEWSHPAARPPAVHRAHAAPAAPARHKRHRHRHLERRSGGRGPPAGARGRAPKRHRAGQGGAGHYDWPLEVGRRGRAAAPEEPWDDEESEDSEPESSGYTRWVGGAADRGWASG